MNIHRASYLCSKKDGDKVIGLINLFIPNLSDIYTISRKHYHDT